jgi:hypothetical protein
MYLFSSVKRKIKRTTSRWVELYKRQAMLVACIRMQRLNY